MTKDTDMQEFGKNPDTYKIIEDLRERWKNGTDSEREELERITQTVRRVAREGKPIEYAQDKIMQTLHKNAKTAMDYQRKKNYRNQSDKGSLYRIKKDGSEKLSEGNISSINVVDDVILFRRTTENKSWFVFCVEKRTEKKIA